MKLNILCNMKLNMINSCYINNIFNTKTYVNLKDYIILFCNLYYIIAKIDSNTKI